MMDSLHLIPSGVGADVFFDVTNAGYHHHYPHHPLPSHGGFWPSPGPRTTTDYREQPGGATASEIAPAKAASSDLRVTEADPRSLEVGHDRTRDGSGSENTSPGSRRGWKAVMEDKKKESESGDAEGSSSPKETQVAVTLKWLSENYELSEGVCLPRCVLYVHYLDLCKRQGFKPAGAATFGKLIRQKFKNITTRRLGTRGQSKYHYYGIGIKESSVYYQAVYTGKGLTRFSGIKIKTEGSHRKYSLSSKTGTLLPEFPDARNLILPDQESADKMNTFIMMYRTHSQRILDTVITANFEEVQNLLIHFWQGYPQHLQDVLQLPVMCDVIAICDSILYKVLTDVLVPSAIQDLPESLSSDLRAFVKSLPHWMQSSLFDLVPENVRKVKSDALQQFIRILSRQLAFIKMAQTARPQMTTMDVTNRALSDLDNIDFEQMCVQTSFAVNDKLLVNHDKAKDVFEEMKTLLRKQSQIESYTEWIDNMIDKCVLQPSGTTEQCPFQQQAGRFLLQWTMFGALVMKDLTLNNARSFSFLHVMKMTLDEYILLVVETQADKHRDEQLQANIQRHMRNAEEVKMHAKMRTQANKLQSSPKARKRKMESEDELDATDTEENCPSSYQRALPSSVYESVNGATFLRCLPSHPAAKEASDSDTAMPALPQCRDMIRPSAINPSSLPLSPIKHYPSYDRTAYHLPAFSFNPYSEYVNHPNSFVPPRQVQTFPAHTTPQPFHAMNFNTAVNTSHPAPPTYWTTDTRSQNPTLSDPYAQLSYNNYQQTYDAYKKNSLLRGSMYQDSLARPNPTFDGLSRASATFDGLARTNSALEGLTRQNASFDPARPPMYYAHDGLQVASSFAVGSYGNSFMEITPSSGQYARQDGLLYQDEMFAPNMNAASGLSGFTKSYIQTGFR